MEFPDVEYRHDNGECSITGGVVYRGEALPWLQGHYFYGDLCRGFIRSFRTADGVQIDDSQDWTSRRGTVGGLWSFGTDGSKELLVVSGTSGVVYRLTQSDSSVGSPAGVRARGRAEVGWSAWSTSIGRGYGGHRRRVSRMRPPPVLPAPHW